MRRATFKAKFIYLLILAWAVGCQAVESPTSSVVPSPTPEIILIPPLQPGDGSDVMDRLLERGVIRVGIRVWPEAEFSPPAFRGASNAETGGILKGFEVDLAYLLAEGLGLDLELVEAYPPMIISGNWQGEWDIALASLSPIPFDQTHLSFSEPYAYIPVAILVPEGSRIQIWEDLLGRKVGVLEDSSYQQFLTNYPDDIEPIPVSNLVKTIHQVAEDEMASVDALFGPASIFQRAMARDLPVRLIMLEDSLPLAVAVTPHQGDLQIDRLLFEINKVLERLHRRGTLAELHLRWYDQDFSRPP